MTEKQRNARRRERQDRRTNSPQEGQGQTPPNSPPLKGIRRREEVTGTHQKHEQPTYARKETQEATLPTSSIPRARSQYRQVQSTDNSISRSLTPIFSRLPRNPPHHSIERPVVIQESPDREINDIDTIGDRLLGDDSPLRPLASPRPSPPASSADPDSDDESIPSHDIDDPSDSSPQENVDEETFEQTVNDKLDQILADQATANTLDKETFNQTMVQLNAKLTAILAAGKPITRGNAIPTPEEEAHIFEVGKNPNRAQRRRDAPQAFGTRGRLYKPYWHLKTRGVWNEAQLHSMRRN